MSIDIISRIRLFLFCRQKVETKRGDNPHVFEKYVISNHFKKDKSYYFIVINIISQFIKKARGIALLSYSVIALLS